MPEDSKPTTSPTGTVATSDDRALRTALGQFATGVTVVTTRARNGQFVGLTANSFGALSLEPPMIIWALRLASSHLAVFQGAERFVVNVLTEAQVDTSRLFASRSEDKFAQVAHAENQDGLPYLHGAAAWFECRLLSHQPAGDHCLFIASVERFSLSESAPLLFHAGVYCTMGSRL